MVRELEGLSKSPLFAGLEPRETFELLSHLAARRTEYGAGAFPVEEGERLRSFGILLSGRARAVKWDRSGRLVILSMLEAGSEIGVILAASPELGSPVAVRAEEPVSVLWISPARLLERGGGGPAEDRLLRRYIRAVAEKGLMLHERIDCLLRPTIREKVWTYLCRLSQEQGSATVTAPLDRAGMAEYLNVDRSALSRELLRMRRDGRINYHKNIFQLI